MCVYLDIYIYNKAAYISYVYQLYWVPKLGQPPRFNPLHASNEPLEIISLSRKLFLAFIIRGWQISLCHVARHGSAGCKQVTTNKKMLLLSSIENGVMWMLKLMQKNTIVGKKEKKKQVRVSTLEPFPKKIGLLHGFFLVCPPAATNH